MNYFIFVHRTTGNFNENEQEEGEHFGGEDSCHELDSDEEIISIQSNTSYSTPKTKSQKISKVQNMTQFQKELIKNLTTSKKDVTSETDQEFLFSLSPDYKRLNYEQKLDFRLMTMQYFKNVSLGFSHSNQLHSTPFSYNPNQNNTQIIPIPTIFKCIFFIQSRSREQSKS